MQLEIRTCKFICLGLQKIEKPKQKIDIEIIIQAKINMGGVGNFKVAFWASRWVEHDLPDLEITMPGLKKIEKNKKQQKMCEIAIAGHF